MAISFRAEALQPRLPTARDPDHRRRPFIGLFCTAQLLMVVMNLGRIPVLSTGERDIPVAFNEICLGVMLAGALLAVRNWREVRIDAVTVACMTFALIGAGSALWSVQRFDLTALQIVVSLSYLARWVLYFFLYVALINVLEPIDAERAWGAIETMLLVFAIFGIIQAAFLPGFAQMVYPDDGNATWDRQGHRLVSTALDPNIAGALLVTGFLVQVGRLAMNADVKWWKMLIMLAAIVLTLSRSAMAGLVVGLAFVLVLRRPTRRLVRWAALFGALFLLAAPFLVQYALAFNKFSFNSGSTASIRLITWLQAIRVIVDHPVFGIGFNAYRYALDYYGIAYFGISSYTVDGGLLFVLAMTGVVGLAVYLLVLWLVLARCRVVWRDPTATPAERGMAVGIAASLIGVIVTSVFINALLTNFVMEVLWVLWALVFVYDRGRRARRPRPAESPVRLVPMAA